MLQNTNQTKASIMWGWPLEWWDSIAYWTLIAGAISGGLAVALTAFSSWITIKTSAIVQRDADEKIAIARARGDEAHEQASKADERAAAASAQAEAARLEQDKIRKENLELSISLEKEKSERLKLEGKLASRHLTKEQRRAIISSLNGEPGPIIIAVTKLGDREAGQYADEIIAALKEISAIHLIENFSGTISPPVYGVVVSPMSDSYLTRALDAAQIVYSRRGGSLFPATIIGLKPPTL
jgi:hypothetical protein